MAQTASKPSNEAIQAAARAAQQPSTNGLCRYEDPERWFRLKDSGVAAGICSNCPVRMACAAAALRVGATDGVWAGVLLPGIREPEELLAARAQLRKVVVGMHFQPTADRQRALEIRAAVRFVANLEHTGA